MSPRRRLTRALVIALLASASVAACQTAVGPPATASPSASAPFPSGTGAAARPILRITLESGVSGPAATLATIPAVSVYPDGRILAPGAVDAIYPGPLLLPVTVRNVGAAGAGAIIAAIRAAGLDKSIAPAAGPADPGITTFEVTIGGATVSNRLVLGSGAPGAGQPGPGGSPDPTLAAAAALVARLANPSDTWGGPALPIVNLIPAGYLVYVAPGAPVSDLGPRPSTRWPLSTPLDQLGSAAVADRGIRGLRQASILGADALTLAPVLLAANSLTPFESGGKLYTLYVRALMPDEVPGLG